MPLGPRSVTKMSGSDGNSVSSPRKRGSKLADEPMDSRLRGNDGRVSSSRLCMSIANSLVAAWYAPQLTLLTAALVPLRVVFRGAVALRRTLYRGGLLRSERLTVPIVVVGNLTVGGSGKTPLTIALAQALAKRGWRAGIGSPGVG